ncbi:hypothetical protein DFR29_1282 [Tahibacter aquaticus]|uniref:Uncharacterized protein n=1 Tax=Tahibacter aquaticus TaxID=520092 RepID=A0A4R6YIC4_9GAMM|nr:hypothetical protein [Tahibacter aquaticus]TDR36581.1 hypothetical protein DFR29_1282 [Tahibacter aquaticus]
MTAAAVAALLIASGYIWLRIWLLSKTVLVRSDSNSLYFLVVVAAFVLGWATYGACVGISRIPIAGHAIAEAATRIAKPLVPDGSTPTAMAAAPVAQEKLVRLALLATVAPGVAWVLALLLNIPLRRSASLSNRLITRLRSAGELDCLVAEAARRKQPVMFTTGSGKVYIGFCLELPDSGPARDWIRLEPVLSGYRDEQQRFEPTTPYGFIHDLPSRSESPNARLCIEDFDIYVAASDIKTFHMFDIVTYLQHFRGPDLATESPIAINPVENRRVGPRAVQTAITKAEWIYLSYVVAVIVAPFSLLFSPWLFLLIAAMALLAGRAASRPEDDPIADAPDASS